MTAICGLIALAAVEMLACPPPPGAGIDGYFSRYDLPPTVGTLDYRQSVGDLPADMSAYAGFIAVADCSLIGREAWVQIGDSGWLPVLVGDCAGDQSTVDWMKENRIMAELDGFLAIEHGYTCRCGWPGRLWIEDNHEQ